MTCQVEDCNQDARARGMCDTHYRRMMRGSGTDHRQPMDEVIYKLRIQNEHGSQPYYFSDYSKARARAFKAAHDGTLLYFAEYTLNRRLS